MSARHRPARRWPRIALSLSLLGVFLGCGSTSSVPSGAGLNVLLISIDTLRADHLGCYGYSLPTSPRLDALANDSVRFARAISQSPWTTPSHMTLMTSLYPSSHQLNQSYDDFEKTARVLPEERLTLAEVMREQGYRTLALTGGATVAGELGFRQGFDEYLQDYTKLGDPVWGQLTTWLDDRREMPFFLFLHTFQVHAPYLDVELAGELLGAEAGAAMQLATAEVFGDPQGGQRRFLAERGLLVPEVTRALYDGGIRVADDFFGRLFDELRRRGLYERTLIVVTSDHGEEFADHTLDKLYDAHGHSQHEELVHVPLLIRFPRLNPAGRVVSSPVGLIDVAPTILDLLDIAVPREMQGRSLEPLWISDTPVRTSIASEATAGRDLEVKALRTGRFSYLASYRTGERGDRSGIPGRLVEASLFDLRNDPREQRDLESQRAALGLRMRRALEVHFDALEPGAKPEVIPIDEELEKSLRGLGYLQ